MKPIAHTQSFPSVPSRSPMPGIVIMGFVLIVALVFFALNSEISDTFPYLYLLPWIIGLCAVFAAPLTYLYYQGRLVVYDPLVYAVWSYLFPAFVVGGIMLLTGWSQPGILNAIEDPSFTLPFTVFLVMLGFAGLSLGYLAPIGSVVGRNIERFLPKWELQPEQFILPGIVLLFIGIANVLIAFAMGIIGYQKPQAISEFDGLIFMSTSMWSQAYFILLYSIFRRKKYDLLFFVISVPLVVAAVVKGLFSGSRASLLQIFLSLVLAYIFAGGKLTVKRGIIAIVLVSAALVGGMIYGTTFRNLKGSESQVSVGSYTENISSTFNSVGRTDFSATMSIAFSTIAVRLDVLSSVAVVVSNYEKLAPYEESYGLDDNVWRDLSTFLIPRFIWRDKPAESDPRRYSDLYFNNAESSFVITPFGDLVRNFGPIGVLIGMFLFGIVLRTLYRALIEDQKLMTWHVVLYFIILNAASYEAFYSTLIPNMTKFGFTAVVGVVIIYLSALFFGYQFKETA